MRIVVPVKQVPPAASFGIDPDTRRARREDVPPVLNAYDRRALGEAVRLRGLAGGEVLVLTMGPPSARRALEECLALGADRAIHMCDPAFAGSDVLATARALAAAIRPLVADLILCGQRSVDGETSQLGPTLAELLSVPQATAVIRVVPSEDGRSLSAERLTDDGRETLDLPLPCLLTAAERLHRPDASGPPSVPGEKSIQTLMAADLGLQPDQLGAIGSPTRVREIRFAETSRRQEILPASSPPILELAVAEIVGARRASPSRLPSRATRMATHASPLRFMPRTLVFAELLHDNSLHPATLSLVRVASCLSGTVSVLLAGGGDLGNLVNALLSEGADQVLIAEAERLSLRDVEPYTWLIAREIRERQPDVVLFAATGFGRDLAPRVAGRLGVGLVSECEEVRVEGDGALRFFRPSSGGTVLAEVEVRSRPALATVRVAALSGTDPVGAGVGACPGRSRGRTGQAQRPVPTYLDVDELPPARVTVNSTQPDVGGRGLALDTADVVVGVGTGIGGPEHLPAIQRLADALGAAISGTRKVVDLGWLPPQQQVGLSGRQIAPRIYLAIGVRGSFNHAIGIRRSGTIIAINTDPRAEIFSECDLGVVGDWRVLVPALLEQVSRFDVRALETRSSKPVQ